jgi:hypothetical protein
VEHCPQIVVDIVGHQMKRQACSQIRIHFCSCGPEETFQLGAGISGARHVCRSFFKVAGRLEGLRRIYAGVNSRKYIFHLWTMGQQAAGI